MNTAKYLRGKEDGLLKKVRKSPLQRSHLLIFASFFAAVGIIRLLLGLAAVPGVVPYEAETGQQFNVSVVSATEASGGRAVRFNASSPTPTPSPTPSPTPTPTPPPGGIGSSCSREEIAVCAEANSSGTFFRETFTRPTSAPTSAMNRMDILPRWFAQPTMQGVLGWDFRSQRMEAQHSADCGPPPGTHVIEEFPSTVFLCRDHIMTAMSPFAGVDGRSGTANGHIVLKPNHMVDLSRGEATISVDVSTESTSAGDWWDIWITPWEDQLVAPSDHWLHQAGPPRNAILLNVSDCPTISGQCPPGDPKNWTPQVYRDFRPQLPQYVNPGSDGIAFWAGPNFRSSVPVSLTRRDPYIVRMTRDRVRLFIKSPVTGEQERLVLEFAIPGGFPSDRAVVQFVHASYNPILNRKLGCGGPDCPTTGRPNTWHWDNAIITPAIEYRLIGTREYQITDVFSSSNRITFNEPAPAGARMLFLGQSLNNQFQLSFNNGTTWLNARAVRPSNGVEGNWPGGAGMDLITYTIDVPTGTTSALIRGNSLGCRNSCGATIDPYGVWAAQNFHLVAL